MTVGDVLFYPGSPADLDQELEDEKTAYSDIAKTCDNRGKCLNPDYYARNLLAHEARHSEQWAKAKSWKTYAADYELESGASYIRCLDWSACNDYEVGAQPFQGGYWKAPKEVNGQFVQGGNPVPDYRLYLR